MGETSLLVHLRVNGVDRTARIDSDDTLLDVLRDRLGLIGTKYNCLQGECGACTVIMDGASVCSCIVLGASADGSTIETIEGLARDGELHPIQQAFSEADGSQCGYCTPGMIMSAKALLDSIPHPDEAAIREGLEGNLCRCTGYAHIVAAVRLASERMEDHA